MLDHRRLGKQRVEVLQILRALTRERYGWKSHPVVRMWAGYDEALHRSHRALLLRKDPEWYRLRLPDAPEDEDYVWPVPRSDPPGGSGRKTSARSLSQVE